jgi:hypothetical protein
MSGRPILGLTLTILLAATLTTPAVAATPQVGAQRANSQPQPNDAFVQDFVFGDGETLASLKLHYLTLEVRVAMRVAQSPMRFCCFTAPPDRLPTSCRLASSIRFTVRGSRSILVAIF